MKSKNQQAYTLAFQQIQKLISKNPKLFLINFEIAVYNAITMIFLGTHINGCNFHFNQLIKKLLIKKILIFCKSDSKYRNFIKFLVIFAYVPDKKIEKEFKKIVSIMKDKDYYKIAVEYFENNFINNEKNKKIQKSFWSINNRVIKDILTTTNSCESFHRHLNSKVSRK
ncbi:hypothetical protein DMUE_3996 [Dictyocoela muelleri]|nr:hypothetical protein DMUE_3996 [Dictyocoela muelleri]